MTMTFAVIDLDKVTYTADIECELLNPVPIDDCVKIYKSYCAHKHFHSVMPMIAGRFLVSGTEVWGYRDNHKLVAWSMYRVWDSQSVVCDQHAWDYFNPKLRLGIRSFRNECARYRDRGFKWVYLESFESYMFEIEGFRILKQWE